MPIWSMAWRNVWRNTRRSVVTIGAMTLALWVMVLYSGLVAGYLGDMESTLLEVELGDLQLHAPGYLERPSLYDVIEEPEPLVTALEEAGYGVSPRLLAGGLGAHGDASAGVSLRGLDVARDREALALHGKITDGEWLDPEDADGVVIGRRLARALGVSVGGELVVLSQAADGSMANALYEVRGILGSVADGTDRAGVFLPAQSFRDLMALDQGVHQIIVRRPEAVLLPDAEAFAEALGTGFEVHTWRELMPTVATMLDSARQIVSVMFFVVYIAVGILVLNAVLMAVFERIREFGVMKAVGVGPRQVFGVILAETAVQAGIATALGLALAAPVGWWLSTSGIDVGVLGGTNVMGVAMSQIWRAQFGPAEILGPLLAMVIIVGAAAIYPAWKAARVRPVEAMRYV